MASMSPGICNNILLDIERWKTKSQIGFHERQIAIRNLEYDIAHSVMRPPSPPPRSSSYATMARYKDKPKPQPPPRSSSYAWSTAIRKFNSPAIVDADAEAQSRGLPKSILVDYDRPRRAVRRRYNVTFQDQSPVQTSFPEFEIEIPRHARRVSWWEIAELDSLPNPDASATNKVDGHENCQSFSPNSAYAEQNFDKPPDRAVSATSSFADADFFTPESRHFQTITLDADSGFSSPSAGPGQEAVIDASVANQPEPCDAAAATERDLLPDPSLAFKSLSSEPPQPPIGSPSTTIRANEERPDQKTADSSTELPANLHQPPIGTTATPTVSCELDLLAISFSTHCFCAVFLACAALEAACRAPAISADTDSTSQGDSDLETPTLPLDINTKADATAVSVDTHADATAVLVLNRADGRFTAEPIKASKSQIDLTASRHLELGIIFESLPVSELSFPFDPGI